MPILFCLNISFFCGLKLFKINFKLMAKCLSLNFGRRLKGQKMPRMIRQIINKTRMCIFCPLPPILFLMDGSTFICFWISYIYQKQMHLTRFCSHLEVCTLKLKQSQMLTTIMVYIIYIVHVLTYSSTIY